MARQHRPLRGIEAAYLALETGDAPMHMGAIAIFEGEPLVDTDGRLRIDDLRRGIESRLHLVPSLRERLFTTPVGTPVWSDDPHFELRNHVHRAAVPAPGGEAELFELCTDLQGVLLDRTRPLWEMWFVEGVSGGRVALIEKIHHAMADGMAGVELSAVLLDVVPTVETGQPVPWEPNEPPRMLRSAVDSVGRMVTTPLRAVRQTTAAARHPVSGLGDVAEMVRVAATIVRDGLRPGTRSLNRPVSDARRLLPVRLPLEAARDVGRARGATVNDVVLASVTGGLRTLLAERGEQVDRITVKALVPVSVRGGDERLTMGNRTAALLVPLPVDEPDPGMRLDQIAVTTAKRKAMHEAEASDRALSLLDAAPRMGAALARWFVPRQPLVNLVVTNMRGADVPLYALGARMLEAFPIVPLGGNLDVGVAILSYNGWLDLTVHADAERCGDADVFARGTEMAFEELVEVASVTKPDSTGTSMNERSRASA